MATPPPQASGGSLSILAPAKAAVDPETASSQRTPTMRHLERVSILSLENDWSVDAVDKNLGELDDYRSASFFLKRDRETLARSRDEFIRLRLATVQGYPKSAFRALNASSLFDEERRRVIVWVTMRLLNFHFNEMENEIVAKLVWVEIRGRWLCQGMTMMEGYFL